MRRRAETASSCGQRHHRLYAHCASRARRSVTWRVVLWTPSEYAHSIGRSARAGNSVEAVRRRRLRVPVQRDFWVRGVDQGNNVRRDRRDALAGRSHASCVYLSHLLVRRLHAVTLMGGDICRRGSMHLIAWCAHTGHGGRGYRPRVAGSGLAARLGAPGQNPRAGTQVSTGSMRVRGENEGSGRRSRGSWGGFWLGGQVGSGCGSRLRLQLGGQAGGSRGS